MFVEVCGAFHAAPSLVMHGMLLIRLWLIVTSKNEKRC
jgi:hypothetical protein